MDIIPEYLNKVGLDAWTVGNHDFDIGESALAEAVKRFDFKVLGGNVKSENEVLKKKLEEYVVINENLVIMGVSAEDTKRFGRPDDKTKFQPEIEAAKRILARIKEEQPGKKIIALTHIGYEHDVKLAAATEGIELIVGGHSHTGMGAGMRSQQPELKLSYPELMPNSKGEKSVCIVQANCNGRYLGEIIPTWKGNKMISCKGKYHELDNTVPSDPDMEKMVQKWSRDNSQVYGESLTNIDRKGRFGKDQAECLMGDLQADAVLEATQAEYPREKIDFAVVTAGIERIDISKGKVDQDILSKFFKDKLTKWSLSGADLHKLLEGVYSKENTFGPKPKKMANDVYIHVSRGIKITFDRSNKSTTGHRLKKVLIDGKPLDMKKKYTIGTQEWILLGKEDIYEKVPEDKYKTFSNVPTAMANYFKKHKQVTVKLDGRLVNEEFEKKD